MEYQLRCNGQIVTVVASLSAAQNRAADLQRTRAGRTSSYGIYKQPTFPWESWALIAVVPSKIKGAAL
jgi:hypothetical protein